jgi:hypothetical protein
MADRAVEQRPSKNSSLHESRAPRQGPRARVSLDRWRVVSRRRTEHAPLFSAAPALGRCCERSSAPRGSDCSNPNRAVRADCARSKIDIPNRDRYREAGGQRRDREGGTETHLGSVDPSQDIIKGRLREGQVLIDRIKIVWVDAGDELVDDPIAFGVGESLSLIFDHFNLLVFVVIDFGAEGCLLFDLVREEGRGARSRERGEEE